MPHVTQPAFPAIALAVKPGVRVGRAFMGLVGPLLAMKIPFRVAARASAIVSALGTETLHRRPGFDQRAVNREMIPAQKTPDLAMLDHAVQDKGRNVGFQQTVPIMAERACVPHRVVHAEPDEQGSGFRFRDTTRAPFTTDVRLRFDRLGGAVSAETADISMEGMFVKTAEPRPVGTLVQFEFDLEEGETVQGLGDVVWVRARGSENKPAGMGIQFRYVDPKSREHVFKIVSNFISQISGSDAMPSIPTDGPPEENPIPTGTVAVPLSSLPGLGSSDDDSGASPGSPTGLEPTDPLAMTPPPPPPASPSDDSPFGGLLRGEGEADATSAKSATSGSFSLSVPRQETRPPESSGGLPALSDAPDFLTGPSADEGSAGESSTSDAGANAASLAATVDYGEAAGSGVAGLGNPSDESEVLAGGLASEPALAPPERTASESSFDGEADDDHGIFDSPAANSTPVEPYVPPRESADLYGGSARAGGGRRGAGLIGILLLVAAAAALYVYRPWERFLGGTAEGPEQAASQAADEAPADAVPEPTGPRVGLVAEEPPPATLDAEGAPEEPTDGAADESTAAPEQSTSPAAVASPPAPARNWPRDGRLGGVEAISGSGQTLVRITADRPLQASEFEAVALASPPRYLVKIRGLDALYIGDIDGLIFRGLRSGVHQVGGRSELHLVFDMTSAGFEAEAELVDGEILVTFR